MKLVLPKASRGYSFNRLVSFELNDFDVERLLPSLFYLVVTRGHQRAGRANDPKALAEYLQALSKHPKMRGFDDPGGSRVLERWVRSSVVHIGAVGRAHRDEQIEFVLPLTLLAYKPGFPAEIRRQRNVHLFLYRILLGLLYALDAKPAPQAALSAIFTAAFGQGAVIGGAPKYDGRYDGETPIDLHSLLCLYFLDGFQAREASRREALEAFGPALPAVAREIGRDLLLYLVGCRGVMPLLALTRGLMALIDFQLVVYTLKIVYATNALVADGTLPPAMNDELMSSPPELYVDFTRERASDSDEIARACVDRDLEEIRIAFDSVMLLRTLDRFVALNVPLKERLNGLPTPAYLQGLVRLRGDASLEARAQMEVEAIRHETLNASQSTTDQQESEALFDEVQRHSAGNALDMAVKLLGMAQQKGAVEAYVRWFWSTGGLRKPFGLLSGNVRGRRKWRYAMGDDLLATLVRLSLLQDPSGRLANVTQRRRLRLGEFLKFLELRFGVLVDRPPSFIDNAQNRAAGKANLEALKRRLRQMGFFSALSDDFTAQYIRVPQDPRELSTDE